MDDWTEYLDSICRDRKYVQRPIYIPTDVEAAKSVTQFDLMVRTFRAEQKPAEEAKEDSRERLEKVEKLNALAGLQKYADEHVLLKGRPGSGKTTTLHKLLLEEADRAKKDPRAKIPVLVELKYYTVSAPDLICDFLARHGRPLNPEELESLLHASRFLVLFDGLNELPSESERKNLSAFRLKFRKSTPMVFTTRDIGMGGDLGMDRKLEMLPLSQEQIEQFVRAYLDDEAKATAMLKRLKDRARELAETPMLLEMLCAVFKATRNIPPQLGSIFRAFVQLHGERLVRDDRADYPSVRLWSEFLAYLAFKMMSSARPIDLSLAMERKEADRILAEFVHERGRDLPEKHISVSLDDVLKHHLLQLGDRDTMDFQHQLIQEYFAAEYLLDRVTDLSDDQLKREYLNYLKWTEPIAMLMELLKDGDQAQRIVNLALDVDLKLGARLAGAARPEFQHQTVRLVTEQELPPKFKIRLLGMTRSESAVAPLIEALNDPNAEVGKQAVRALGQIGSDAAVKALTDALKDREDGVRWEAALALGKTGSDAAVQPLIAALKDRESGGGRATAARVLGNIGSDAAVKALTDALKDREDGVRDTAAFALGDIGSDAAVQPLIELLKDRVSWVRGAAAWALGNIGSDAAVQPLIELLKDRESEVRESAAWVLGEIGSDAAVQPLIETLKDRDSEVSKAAASALGKIGTDAAVRALIEAPKDQEAGVRETAADALGEIRSAPGVPVLISALEDQHWYPREDAAAALKKLGQHEVLPQLSEILLRTDQEDVLDVIEAIQERSRFYNPDLIRIEREFHILHLSDLHFGKSEDAINHLAALVLDIQKELKPPRIDAVVVSGDITNKAHEDEYEPAVEFLRGLMETFSIAANQVVLVPGNHDLSRDISRKARNEAERRKRFAHFSRFYRRITKKAYPLAYENQRILFEFPEQKALFLGLNSAWRINHKDTTRADINGPALSKAILALGQSHEDWVKIAVWHHPIYAPGEDRIKDDGFLELLAQAGFRIALHGHGHKADTTPYELDQSPGGREIRIVGAGTLGAPPGELVTAYPWQYGFITIERGNVRVHTRKREKEFGAWGPDARWRQGAGQEPLSYYDFDV